MKLNIVTRIGLPILLTCLSLPALAGPPFDVEDPETTEPGHYELDVAGTSNQVRGSETQAFPAFGLAYGYNNNLALSIGLGAVSARTTGRGRTIGFGDVTPGVKWRFHEETKSSPQFALEYNVKIPTASRSHGLGTGAFDHNVLLASQKAFGRSTVFGNIGYNFLGDHESRNNLLYGLVYTFQLTEHLNVGAEVYGNTSAAPGQPAELAWGVGLSYNLAPDRVLMLKAGRSTQGLSDLNIYAGVQFVWGHSHGKAEKDDDDKK